MSASKILGPWFVFLTSFSAVLLAALPDPVAAEIELLIAEGDPRPEGGSFFSFGTVGIDGSSRVVVAAGGLYEVDGGTVAAIAIAGDPAPDSGGGTFSSPSCCGNSLFVSEGGDVLFRAFHSGGSAGNPGLFRFGASSSGVAFGGESAPDTVETYTSFFWSGINASGDLAFNASLSDGTRGVFGSDGVTDHAIALDGDSVQGEAPIAAFGLFNALPRIDDSGRVVFVAENTARILSELGGTISLVVDDADIAPGTGGLTYGGFLSNSLSVNSAGDLVFHAFPGGDGGVFAILSGTPTLVALVGDAAPGTGGGTFDTVLPFGVDAAGRVGFSSTIAGGATTAAIYLGTPGDLQPIVLAGDTAPDTGGGVFDGFGSIAMNESGAVAFQADVTAGTVSEGVFLPEPGRHWLIGAGIMLLLLLRRFQVREADSPSPSSR